MTSATRCCRAIFGRRQDVIIGVPWVVVVGGDRISRPTHIIFLRLFPNLLNLIRTGLLFLLLQTLLLLSGSLLDNHLLWSLLDLGSLFRSCFCVSLTRSPLRWCLLLLQLCFLLPLFSLSHFTSLFCNEFIASFQDVFGQFWSGNSMHFLVMNENLRWESFQDPDMFEGLVRAHALVWIPL